jgi:hypothetical protein
MYRRILQFGRDVDSTSKSKYSEMSMGACQPGGNGNSGEKRF